jgi:spore maturation protein CgeB
MKILFVDLEFDYGDQKRGINTIGQLGFHKSLQKLGHSVSTFYYDYYLKGNLKKLQVDLKEKADQVQPDLIFFILFRDQFEIETLEYLKSKYKTMNWFGDDTWRFDSFTQKYAPHFTYCVTTDKFALPKYRKLGVQNVVWAQWAAIDDDREVMNLPYQFEVTFIGAKNPYRQYLINYFKNHGIKVECFGNGWPNGMISNDKMINVFNTSKINLNLSNSASWDLRYLLKNPKNILHSFHTKKQFSQTKARNFEINFYNGFQLADYVPSLEDYYHIGKEIACYTNPDEAILLMVYYLENDEERERIKLSGFKKARECYSYTHQLKKVFEEFSL